MFALSFTTTLLWFSSLLVQQHSIFAAATACTRSYTVQDGDTCDAISAAHNVSTYQLAAVNPNIDQSCSNLMPGQTLCLGTEGEDCTTTYVVVPGDTCEAVQQSVGVNSTIFFLNNPQIGNDCLNLYVGEVVCTAQSVLAPPAGSQGPVDPQTTTTTATTATTTKSSTTYTEHVHTELSAPTATPPSDEDLPFCDEI